VTWRCRPDAGRQPGKEQAAGRQHAPHLFEQCGKSPSSRAKCSTALQMTASVEPSPQGSESSDPHWIWSAGSAGANAAESWRTDRIAAAALLRPEIYVTASVLGACTYVGLNGLGVGRLPAMGAARF
jgi:hypothetical protein